ncbi:porin [Ferrimonas balearica]|uniref:porin n=1 Tax=Ferrimonas balearica TaxID=44012 RepID=UPI001F38F5E4|nr:porin [Ferrimonas balearica]MBY6016493.1 porin [Halomonas denitrificans]MBY6095236.1 porin [Ferrimonas balearica]
MMNKFALSTLAVALSATSLMAQAEAPQFYGALRASVTHADTGFASNPGGGEGTQLENDFSMIGVRGSHAVSDTLNVVYQAEVQVNGMDQDNGKDPFSSRNTYLGLDSSQLGRLIFGRHDQAFMLAEGKVDQFNLTNTDMNRLLAGNNRHGDQVMYFSPNMAGFQFIGSYLLEDDYYASGKAPEGVDPYSVTVSYGDKMMKKQPYFFAVAYNGGIGGDEAVRATGQYKLGDFKIGAVYQNTQDKEFDNLDGNGFIVDLAYGLTEKLSLKARYGQDDSGNGGYIGKVMGSLDGLDKTTVDSTKVTNYAVGADYALSKQTKLFAHYSVFDAEVKTAAATLYDDTDNLFTVGMHYKF